MTTPETQFQSRAVRALVILHDQQLRRFFDVWTRARAASVTLPLTDDPAYESLDALGRHVFGAAGRYVIWICEVLKLPDPGIRATPSAATLAVDAEPFMEHTLAQWQTALVDVRDDQLDHPEYPSRWKTLYSIDAMLEHAVMHPIRHTFQLEQLMRARS